jgi:hypothetical protein
MGFMDKVKAQATVLADKAQTGVQQGQTKLAELQTGKQEDHLLRELGAYVFLSERGRLQPDSEAKVAGLMGQLDALEAAGSPVTITPEPSVAPAACPRPPRRSRRRSLIPRPRLPRLHPLPRPLRRPLRVVPSPSRATVSRASSAATSRTGPAAGCHR